MLLLLHEAQGVYGTLESHTSPKAIMISSLQSWTELLSAKICITNGMDVLPTLSLHNIGLIIPIYALQCSTAKGKSHLKSNFAASVMRNKPLLHIAVVLGHKPADILLLWLTSAEKVSRLDG